MPQNNYIKFCKEIGLDPFLKDSFKKWENTLPIYSEEELIYLAYKARKLEIKRGAKKSFLSSLNEGLLVFMVIISLLATYEALTGEPPSLPEPTKFPPPKIFLNQSTVVDSNSLYDGSKIKEGPRNRLRAKRKGVSL